MKLLKRLNSAIQIIPGDVYLAIGCVFIVWAALNNEGHLRYHSVLVGLYLALVVSSLAERHSRRRLKRLLHREARPRILVKGQPTDAGDPPDDPQVLISVWMTRHAAYELRKALIGADGVLNPDFRHPEDDPNALHAEWLMWAVGRIEVAEELSNEVAGDV